MENRYEIYYSIVNIVDFLALAPDASLLIKTLLNKVLDDLLWVESKINGESESETFEAIADVNNVSGVETWDQMIRAFRELHENGDRISIG